MRGCRDALKSDSQTADTEILARLLDLNLDREPV